MKAQKTKTQKPKNTKKDTLLTLLIAAIIFIVCWFLFIKPVIDGSKNVPQTPTPQAWKWLKDDSACDALVCVKVDNTEFNTTYGYGHIYGRAINNSGKDFSYIAVNFGLYDGDVKTGSCIANQNYLSNGTTWSFEAVCTGTSGASYKVENVTYY